METCFESVLKEDEAVRLTLVLSCFMARGSCGRDDGEGRKRGKDGRGHGDAELPSFAMDPSARTYILHISYMYEHRRDRQIERFGRFIYIHEFSYMNGEHLPKAIESPPVSRPRT